MLVVALVVLMYVIGVLITATLGGRLARSEAETAYIALSALMWPLAVPFIVVFGGALLFVGLVQRLGR